MNRQIHNVPCPGCNNSTVVITGHVANSGYTRRRFCKGCECKFTTYQGKDTDTETVALVLAKGSASIARTDDDDEPDEPEPATSWRDTHQMRRAMLISAFLDVKWFGSLDPETLALAGQVRERKQRARIAA